MAQPHRRGVGELDHGRYLAAGREFRSLVMEPAGDPERLNAWLWHDACLITGRAKIHAVTCIENRAKVVAVSREGSLRVGYLSIDSLINDLGNKQRCFAEVSAELAALRYQVQSDDNAVHVTVNGHGNLLDLRISPGELRRTHSSMLGSKIMSAIRKAREEVGEVNRARLEEAIDGVAAPPAAGDPSNQHPSHRAAVASSLRRSRPRDDDDEDFSQASYLR